eukprot:SAG11_NODE_29377_length_311_cov_1.132075_2_plen_57_part_01
MWSAETAGCSSWYANHRHPLGPFPLAEPAAVPHSFRITAAWKPQVELLSAGGPVLPS